MLFILEVKMSQFFTPVTGDIFKFAGNFVAVLDVDAITIYKVDENKIITDVYDRVLYPNVVFTCLNLRLNNDGTPYAVELWYEDHDGGVNVCKWYHLLPENN